MKVRQLISQLEGLPENGEVILATQPNYPFFNSIYKVVDYVATEDDGALNEDEIYAVILEGDQLGYADRDLW